MPPVPLRHRVLAWGSSGLHIPGAGGSATVRTSHRSLCLPLALFGHHLDWGTRGGLRALARPWACAASASFLKLPLPVGKPPFSRTPISNYAPRTSSPSSSTLPAAPAAHCGPIPLNQSILRCAVEIALDLHPNSSPSPKPRQLLLVSVTS